MAKVGILSMQKVKNHGSFLQAYALMKLIVDEFGHKIAFVDFSTKAGIIDPCQNTYEKLKKKKFKYWLIRSVVGLTRIPLIGRLLLKIKKINAWKNMLSFFDLYCKRFETEFWKLLPMSNKTLAQSEGIDTLVVGSDEVFNFSINEKVGYSDELFAVGSKAKKNISFSACFGCSKISDLTKMGNENKIKRYLSAFDGLSVRDRNSLQIAETLLGQGKEISYHLDPVFYYDFENELPPIKRKKPYLVVYSYTGLKETEKESIANFAREKKLDVLCFLGYQGELGQFMNVSPFEVLSYIKNAAYIVTTTFHGCVLAVKYRKQFCVIVQKKVGAYGNEEKVYDLINRLNLSNRSIENCVSLEEKMEQSIDYDYASRYISNSKDDAITYLKKYL